MRQIEKDEKKKFLTNTYNQLLFFLGSLSIVHVSFTHITKQNEQGYLELISVWFPLICNRLARSEDALIIQECTGALAALVEHAPHTIQRL